jgi:hypothetical protein
VWDVTYLVVGVAILCVLCLFDLLLTLGVVKRLRDHENRLAKPTGYEAMGNLASSLVQGSRPGAFDVRTTEGDLLTLDGMIDGAVVAFMSPHCKPCVSKLPAFIEHTSALPDGKLRVTVVLTGEEAEATPMAAQLEQVARVVIEPFDGPMTTAFAVTALPVIFVLTGEGRVAATSYEIDQLLGPMAAVVS